MLCCTILSLVLVPTISRATSLDGVFILRPFRKKVIQCRPSQDVRDEFKRLDVLAHQTKMKYGTPEDASEAQRYLVENFSPAALPQDDDAIEQNHLQDARALARLQTASSRLLNGPAVPTDADYSPCSRRPRYVRSQPVAAQISSTKAARSRRYYHTEASAPQAEIKFRLPSTIPNISVGPARTKRWNIH
ncbi:hypothetical protein DFH09DRAFT_1104468 [Mycena vulgaris]|nr:hypothetical protein DFH09DRAFT_1104468 [Mycena vulgaris]